MSKSAELLLTQEQREQIRSGKSVGFIRIHPKDFLLLTGDPIIAAALADDPELLVKLANVKIYDSHLRKQWKDLLNDPKRTEELFDRIAEEVQPLSFYNDLAEKGRIIIPPYLSVDIATGKVEGHEGRHRAGALLRADPTADMWVAIILKEEGIDRYYRSAKDWTKTYLTTADIPKKFKGEFMSTEVPVSNNPHIDLWA